VPSATPERDVAALLAQALAPTPVHWGWAPFEASAEPPSLPVVILQRLSFSTAGYEDLCSDAAYLGDTLLAVTVWAQGYEDARALNANARSAMAGAPGWRLQQELDLYEPAFRAWSIAGHWLAPGIAPA
jgi:hypothetical protein